MDRVRFLARCLVVVAAISAVAAASASASPPEFGRCVKLAAEKTGMHMRTMGFHGHYSNATCTMASPEANGKYEWLPGVEKKHFTTVSKPGMKVVLQATLGGEMVCSNETSVGEYASPKLELGIVVTLTGCEINGAPVTSSQAKGGPSETSPGEVVIEANECELGVVATGATPAQNKLGLSCGEEGEFAWLKWAGGYASELELRGWWFYAIKANMNMHMGMGAMPVLLRSTQSKGLQTYDKFVEGPFEGLESSMNGGLYWYPTALQLTALQTNEEAVEANSVA